MWMMEISPCDPGAVAQESRISPVSRSRAKTSKFSSQSLNAEQWTVMQVTALTSRPWVDGVLWSGTRGMMVIEPPGPSSSVRVSPR